MKTRASLRMILVAACLAGVTVVSTAHAQSSPQLVTNGPQTSSGDSDPDLGRLNVADSDRYEQMLRTNAAFRQQRMQRECGSIDDQSLRSQCLASFR